MMFQIKFASRVLCYASDNVDYIDDISFMDTVILLLGAGLTETNIKKF